MVSMVLKECESLTSPEWNTNSSYEDNINAPENKNEMAFKKKTFTYSKDSASWAGSAATSTDVGATGQGGVLTRRGGGNQDVIYGG